jgi:2-polyprenyl-3-methyl-5-hydroxy-6-metoxy-1,4-benzoquinol methylase
MPPELYWDGIIISADEAEIAKQYNRKVTLYNIESGLPLELLESDYKVCICSHVLEHNACQRSF